MSRQKHADLHIVLAESLMNDLLLLIQNGFSLRFKEACSVNTFLCGRLGVSREYIEERIQTIFLDGKPVDDLDTAMVRNGSSLALSAAMPGLVGAAMRRGGYYGQLRSTITYRARPSPGDREEGLAHVKIFNLLMHDLGPGLLRKGILVPSGDLAAFLSRLPAAFWAGCSLVRLAGETISSAHLLREGRLSRYELIGLTVETEP